MADTGRPSLYTQDLALTICERLADGESLRTIGCDPEMPSQATIYRWLIAHEEFRDMYARARETQADTLFDEMLDIADNAANDWMERSEEKGGGYELNGEHVQRTRLRLDTRKWMAAKLRPKKYGEKLDIEHTASGDLAAIIAGRRAKVAAMNEGGDAG